MKEHRHGAHTVYEIHLHIVWVTKYRRGVLTTEIGMRLRDLIRDICRAEQVTVMKGHVSKDHVHIMVSIPPQLAISNLVQKLKGKSAYKLLGEFPKLRKQYWGGHLWARGFFCRSSGNVTDEIIKQYIANQTHDADEDFRVEGEDSPKGETPSS